MWCCRAHCWFRAGLVKGAFDTEWFEIWVNVDGDCFSERAPGRGFTEQVYRSLGGMTSPFVFATRWLPSRSLVRGCSPVPRDQER